MTEHGQDHLEADQDLHEDLGLRELQVLVRRAVKYNPSHPGESLRSRVYKNKTRRDKA